jgi:hypothetical protein
MLRLLLHACLSLGIIVSGYPHIHQETASPATFRVTNPVAASSNVSAQVVTNRTWTNSK